MGKLIGRSKELDSLRGFLASPTLRGCAMFGIRQVGKTAILREIASETRSVYIQFSKGSEETMVRRAMSFVRRSYRTDREPTTLSDLLDILEAICREAPALIIMDEYPYLSGSLEHSNSMIQGFMDHVIQDTGSKMIVCGSQLSSILDIIRNASNPLYNRFRFTMEVKPLTFEETCLFHPAMNDMDKIRMYMVLGGMPLDHIEFTGTSFREVVENVFLAKGLSYRSVARARIGSELADTDSYEAIIRAIADGRERLRDISQYTGVPASTCLKHLGKLESIGVVGRYNPMCGAPKKPVYMIRDGLVALWYHVFDGLDEFMLPDDPKSRYALVEDSANTLMGYRFELFCAEFMRRNYACDEVGRWWGEEVDEDGNRVGTDIDLVAKVRENGKRFTVFGECKFRNRMMKMRDLETLEGRARNLDDRANFVLFSAGGFERELIALAWRHGAILIGLDEFMGRSPAPLLLTPSHSPTSMASEPE